MAIGNGREDSVEHRHESAVRDVFPMRREGDDVDLSRRTDREQQPEGDAFTDELAYWKQRLEGAALVLELPTDHPRSIDKTCTHARQSFELPSVLTIALQTLSQREGVSLFITLLAVFQTLLHRYTGQEDILLGTPTVASTDCFANILVLRADLSGDPSFREVLKRAHEVTLDAYAHRQVSFAQLVEALQPERDLRRSPLIQVMFALETPPHAVLELGALDPRSQELVGGMANCDLTLVVHEREEGLSGWVEYRTDLFDPATVDRLVGNWQTLLESSVTEPDQRLSKLRLLTEAERHLLLVEWNDTATDYPGNHCIHQLFEAQVKRTPDAVAVVYDGTSLTYRELNRRANQLAHYLQKMGVEPEMLVGLCVERSLELIVGLLGVLKAGGVYVPLDPVYPPERLSFMLADAHISVLLTQERLTAKIPKQQTEVIYLDTGWDEINQESEEDPRSGVTVANAAYVIYTSGSTGTPKGVVIQHASLVNYTEAAGAAYALKPGDRVLQFASICFDASAEEIYPCLTRGATLVLRTDSMLDSISVFLQKCQDWALTVLDLPTAYWHELTRKMSDGAMTLPPSIRLVIIGGESALPDLLVSWQKHVGQHVQLVNTYGPTEATIVATTCTFWGSTEAETLLHEVPIGRPVPNVQVYLLDRYLNAVPVGVPGELHIGGAGLARGYLNRPELTAEKFIRHPFRAEQGAYLYKTGDLARYLPTGDIAFLGRVDHQVKIRGYRVELGEIEAVLGKHPAVQECVVIIREDVPGDKRLVAYVVPQHDQATTSSELRNTVQEQLPDYMVPAAFVLLESLPLTPNGKVDRRALPAPDWNRSKMNGTFAAPTLPEHEQLIQIWEELLDIRPIGIRDNFFDLGGHSLLAVRLVDRIEQVWGKKISAHILLTGSTIEQLSNVLLQPIDTDSAAALVTLQEDGCKQPLFSEQMSLTSRVKTLWSKLTGRRGRPLSGNT